MERVQEIVQQRLNDDAKLQYMSPEAVHMELMQEMDRYANKARLHGCLPTMCIGFICVRYPLVERAIADLPVLSDPSFNARIRKRLDDLAKTKPRTGTTIDYAFAFMLKLYQ